MEATKLRKRFHRHEVLIRGTVGKNKIMSKLSVLLK